MTLETLARQSVEQGLSPADLIKLYKKNGFMKNARGKAWTTGTVYQHQMKARKSVSDEPKMTKPTFEETPGQSFERLMKSEIPTEKKLELASSVLKGNALPDSVLTITSVEDGNLILRFDSLNYPGDHTLVELDYAEALALLGAVEKIQKFVEVM